MTDILAKFSLEGKNALIVCPEKPYGREIAAGLASAGAKIWLAGSKEPDFPHAGFFPYDHGSAEAAAALETAVRDTLPSLDVVVENGLFPADAGPAPDFEAIHAQLRATHLGMMLTVQALGRILTDQGHGSVILVTDYGALAGYDPQNAAACPACAPSEATLLRGFALGGAVNYARQASNWLAEHGCRCNALAFAPPEGSVPDAFREAFVRHSQIGRLTRPEDAAAAAVFLASDASAFITGVTLPVDGGYTAK